MSPPLEPRTLAGTQRLDGPHRGTSFSPAPAEELIEEADISAGSWSSTLIAGLDPRRWLRSVLLLDDTPHSIALGLSIGLFVGMTPTVGVQMVIVLVVALLTGWLFHFNRVAALVAVYISNPLTMLPIFWFNYRVGTLFMAETVSWEQFSQMIQYGSPAEWVTTLQSLLFRVGMPLLLGSLVAGTVLGLIAYPAFRALAAQMQRHQRHETENLA